MMEKRNIEEKDAAGDAGVIDDIVDAAAGKMAKAGTGPRKPERRLVREAMSGVTEPAAVTDTAVC